MTELYKVMARVVSQKGTCAAGLKVGDEFPAGEKTPGNICSFAYTAIFPFAVALMTDGAFPWEKDPDRTTVACPDAENPVVIELRRIRQ
jgi:uncharacterized repeat protein (TIGR04076 family)